MRTILALGLTAAMTTTAAAQSLTVDDYVQIRQVADRKSTRLNSSHT